MSVPTAARGPNFDPYAVRPSSPDPLTRERLDEALSEWWDDVHPVSSHACRPRPSEDEFLAIASRLGLTVALSAPPDHRLREAAQRREDAEEDRADFETLLHERWAETGEQTSDEDEERRGRLENEVAEATLALRAALSEATPSPSMGRLPEPGSNLDDPFSEATPDPDPTLDEQRFADELRAAITDLNRDTDSIFDFAWDLLARRVRIPAR